MCKQHDYDFVIAPDKKSTLFMFRTTQNKRRSITLPFSIGEVCRCCGKSKHINVLYEEELRKSTNFELIQRILAYEF